MFYLQAGRVSSYNDIYNRQFDRIGAEMKTIILASQSPRRRELMKQIGLKCEVYPSEVTEDIDRRLGPHELAKSLSAAKAEAVARRHPHALIIAADTLILFEGKVMGKPADRNDARRMLGELSGKAHLVITGFTVADGGRAVSRSVETKVYLKTLPPDEIEAYVNSGEPMGKAGAYAIQGLGAAIVEKIEGDYFNVVGLPLHALTETLKEFGVEVLK